MAYAYLNRANFILMLLKPSGEVLRVWYTLKSEFAFGLLVSTARYCSGGNALNRSISKPNETER